MKDLAIFSLELIFFIDAFLEKLWQSICSCVWFILMILNLEMLLRELLGLAKLSKAQIFCIYKATKVIVIYEDKYFVLITFQIVMSYLESFNNS